MILWPMVTQISKLKPCLAEIVGSYEIKSYIKAEESKEIKIYTNEIVHMTKMAAMPVYCKKPLKIFFPRTNGPLALKLGMQH